MSLVVPSLIPRIHLCLHGCTCTGVNVCMQRSEDNLGCEFSGLCIAIESVFDLECHHIGRASWPVCAQGSIHFLSHGKCVPPLSASSAGSRDPDSVIKPAKQAFYQWRLFQRIYNGMGGVSPKC